MKYNGSEIISEILNEWRNSVPFCVSFVDRVNFRDGCVEIKRRGRWELPGGGLTGC